MLIVANKTLMLSVVIVTTLTIMMLCIKVLFATIAINDTRHEQRSVSTLYCYAGCHYTECHRDESFNAERHYSECRCAECRGAAWTLILTSKQVKFGLEIPRQVWL
jgi:hypothetical protein